MNESNRKPLTAEQREKVVREAFSWLGTKYHHCADVKGAGVDCAMILVRIYCDLQIAPKFDPRPYSPQWFLHREEEKYIKWLEQYCDRVDIALPGDIALFRFGRCAAHGAVVIDENSMIHAYQPSGVVEYVERRFFKDRLDSYWSPRNMT